MTDSGVHDGGIFTMTPTARVLDLDSLHLEAGAHAADHAFCVMEAVAYVAGERWSDSPQCSDPVLTRFCQVLNDCWSGADRQLLKPFIPLLGKTRGSQALSTNGTYALG